MLFDAHGIDRVTMAAITAASGVQPSTIYKYFPGKDEIVAALVGEIFTLGTERLHSTLHEQSSALAKIAALFDHLADELAHRPKNVRFMAQFDALYARDWPVERLLALEAQVGLRNFTFLTRLIRQGIADGSLRSDLHPAFTLHAVLNAVIGVQRRFAVLDDKVEQEFGQSTERLFREALRILLLGLAAPVQAETSSRKTEKSTRTRRSAPEATRRKA